MRYVTLGDTFDFKFSTRRFSTGAPFTLAGSPVLSAYPDNSTTEITAGITLTVDFDSRTGLNHVRVVATGGNGYAAGYYAFVITTGTVDSVSVVGETVAEVVIGTVPANVVSLAAGAITAAAIATGAIDADALATDAVTEIQTGLATAAAVTAVQADTDDIQTRLPAALVGGRMDASVGAMAAGVVTAAAIATDAIDSDALAASAVTEIQAGLTAPTAAQVADAVWDEAISGHLTAGSTGAALNAAGSAGDPWATPLPGAYGAGTAGKIVGDNIDAPVSGVPTAVWASGTRTLTSFGTLVADVATAVWAAGTRTLTSFGTLVADVWAGVPAAFFAKFFTQDSGQTYAGAVAGSVVKEIATNSSGGGGGGPTAADIADAVWDELLAGHAISGSTGAALAAAAAGGSGPTATQIADEILKRDWTAVSGEAARSVLNALRFLRNKWDVAGGILTVTKEDDTAVAWSATLTTAAGANPITGSDPA